MIHAYLSSPEEIIDEARNGRMVTGVDKLGLDLMARNNGYGLNTVDERPLRDTA